jgi:nucleoside-diphosphate-sugar epimerase
VRILVTGASGFVGSHVVRWLQREGQEVHAVSDHAADYPSPVQGHVVDLLGGEMHALIRSVRPTHLLHLAWHVPPGEFWTATENVRWLQASLDLVQAFAAAGGKRWVGAGTCAEYDWSRGGIFRENDPIRPTNLYGACKSALQMNAELLGKKLGVEVAWGRIFFPYGPGEPSVRLVASVIQSLLRDKPALCTEGNQVRDFLFVGDVARAFGALLGSSLQGPVNIGSGIPIAVRGLVSQIAEIVGRADLVRFGALPGRDDEPSEIVADTRTLRSIGFEVRYSLRQGLERSVEWWRSRIQ